MISHNGGGHYKNQRASITISFRSHADAAFPNILSYDSNLLIQIPASVVSQLEDFVKVTGLLLSHEVLHVTHYEWFGL